MNSSKLQQMCIDGPIIIGAGPSGLATAACLARKGIPFTILEKNDSIASLWKNKTYDHLKLHLPKNYCQLPFKPFPKKTPKYPSKQHFISYMESYAEHFSIRPEFNQTVAKTEYDTVFGVWRVETLEFEYVGKWVVVATGENSEPFVPEIIGMDKFKGILMHTSEYKNGSQFENRNVLVIGCGNSGMDVSLDLCGHNATPYMVVRDTIHVLPRDVFGLSSFGIAMTLQKWLSMKLVDKIILQIAKFTLGNTKEYGLRCPKTGPLALKKTIGKSPVLDAGALAEIKLGKIKIMGGVQEITNTGAKFIDGQEMEFDSIIFATGYKSNVRTWLKSGEFCGKYGIPKMPFTNSWKGQNGLYMVGFTRRGILGTALDAIKIASDISEQWMRIKDTKICYNSHTNMRREASLQ